MEQFSQEEIDELFMQACMLGDMPRINKMLDSKLLPTQRCLDESFRYVCADGCLPLVKLLTSKDFNDACGTTPDIHSFDEYPFRMSCVNGHVAVAQYLVSIEGDKPINIHAMNEYAFRIACGNGSLEVVKYFLSLNKGTWRKGTTSATAAFEEAFQHNQHHIVDYLLWERKVLFTPRVQSLLKKKLHSDEAVQALELSIKLHHELEEKSATRKVKI